MNSPVGTTEKSMVLEYQYEKEISLPNSYTTSYENLVTEIIESGTTNVPSLSNYDDFQLENKFNREYEEFTTLENVEKDNSNDSYVWNKFFDSLYRKLSEYKFQENIKKYNVLNIEGWGTTNKSQEIKIDKENIFIFLSKISNYNIAEYDYIKSKVDEQGITEARIKKLNQLLDFTLQKDVKYDVKCMGSYKVIKGNFISLKKIITENYLKNDCVNSDVDQPSSIAIFALNTIFIDYNLTRYGDMISIFSPKWEIIGYRKIDLSGIDGDFYKPQKIKQLVNDKNKVQSITENNSFGRLKVELQEKVNENSKSGALKEEPNEVVFENEKLKDYGKSGNPGLPGGPGGVFFGIGAKFVNGKNLKIIASGGQGGAGENGHAGMDGLDGEAAILPAKPDCSEILCSDPLVRCGEFYCLKGKSYGAGVYPSVVQYEKTDCHFKLLGESGQDGEPGGDGGRGGKGGKAGYVVLFELNGSISGISKVNNPGQHGDHGIGGKGGIGGKNGNNLSYNCSTQQFDRPKREEEINNERAPSGENGGIGANTDEMKDPRDINRIYNPSEIVSEYKNYVRENLSNSFESSSLIKFLKQLDNDDNIKSIYSLLGLFDELTKLEQQFYKLNIDDGYVPLYQSLLDRIQDFSRAIRKLDNHFEYDQYKKSLNYLYTTVEQKMFDLKEDLDSMLITNVENYLSSMKKNIDELKKLTAEKNKADIIEEQRKKYKKNLDEKIKEARDLIENQISAEIHNINAEIDSNIEGLIRKIANSQKQKKIDEKKLQAAKDELQKTLKWKTFFNVLSFATKTISILGPAGAFAGSLLGDIESTTETIVLSKMNFELFDKKLLQLSPQVVTQIRAGKGLISSIMNEKIGSFQKLLGQVDKEIKKDNEQFGSMSKQISSMKDRLSKINPNNYNIGKVQILENELNQMVKAMKDKSSEINDKNEAQTVRAQVEMVESGIQKFHQVGRAVVDLVNKFKNDPTKMKELTAAIMKNQLDVKKLKLEEEAIHSMITPTINEIQNDMDKAQLSTKSKVALDVTKWRVQNTLKNVRLKLIEMSKNFQMAEVFGRSLDKLDAALNILIEVYDHIQDYQQQQSVHNYIADISSVQANSISTRDLSLEKAITQLEIAMRSNSIVKQYRLAVDVLKQFAFPFAHLYLNQVSLPENLILENNLENLAYEAIEQIDTMLMNFLKYKSFHTYQSRIGFGEFNSYGETTKPLFVWKNENFKDSISDLLSGRKVLLNADISKSEIKEDAVKFKVLNIDFRAKNNTNQSKINDLLKAFRIEMIHLGDSYYKFENKVYVLPTKNYSIWYNFEKNSNGIPKLRSSEYDEISKGDYILSPYALWKVSLINLPNKRNITFDDLRNYKDEVDLELTGETSFIYKLNQETDNSKLLENKYYKSIDNYETSLINKSEILKSKKLLIEKIIKIYEEPEKNTTTSIKDTTPNSWFTWKLPNIKILPGADAFSTEELNLLNYNTLEYDYFKEFENSEHASADIETAAKENCFTISKNSDSEKSKSYTFLNNLSSYFLKGIKKIKDFVLSNIEDNDSSVDHFSRQGLTISIEENGKEQSSNLIGCTSEQDNIQAVTLKNLLENHNLILAQLVFGKFFGPNQALRDRCYISPSQEQSIKLSQLSAEVMDNLKNAEFGFYEVDSLKAFDDKSSTWYQDIYK